MALLYGPSWKTAPPATFASFWNFGEQQFERGATKWNGEDGEKIKFRRFHEMSSPGLNETGRAATAAQFGTMKTPLRRSDVADPTTNGCPKQSRRAWCGKKKKHLRPFVPGGWILGPAGYKWRDDKSHETWRLASETGIAGVAPWPKAVNMSEMFPEGVIPLTISEKYFKKVSVAKKKAAAANLGVDGCDKPEPVAVDYYTRSSKCCVCAWRKNTTKLALKNCACCQNSGVQCASEKFKGQCVRPKHQEECTYD
jgi:hypothetical protein